MAQQPQSPWQGPQPPDGSPTSSPPTQAHAYAHALPYAGDPYQQVRDADHMKVLSICYYIWGAMSAVFSMCGLFYIFMGLSVIHDTSAWNSTGPGPTTQTAQQSPTFLGYFFAGMGSAVILIGSLVGGLTIYAGRCLARRKHRTFTLIMAGVNCLSIPVGTALGVFTFLVLMRDSVRASYGSQPSPGAAGAHAGASYSR
jgi:hypothetical protein